MKWGLNLSDPWECLVWLRSCPYESCLAWSDPRRELAADIGRLDEPWRHLLTTMCTTLLCTIVLAWAFISLKRQDNSLMLSIPSSLTVNPPLSVRKDIKFNLIELEKIELNKMMDQFIFNYRQVSWRWEKHFEMEALSLIIYKYSWTFSSNKHLKFLPLSLHHLLCPLHTFS